MSAIWIPPALALVAVLGLVYASLAYLVLGKSWHDGLWFFVMAFGGFWVGELLAYLLGLEVFRLGQVHLVEGTLFAWLFIFAYAWLRG